MKPMSNSQTLTQWHRAAGQPLATALLVPEFGIAFVF